MEEDLNLEHYLSQGVENIIKGVIKASLTNPKESLFMAKYALDSQKARKLRKEAVARGEHIPPFLIASITSQCNLHCTGCYARANKACTDQEAKNQLTVKEWYHIFNEAKELGIGFILLAGGEPLLRMDIITEAGRIPDILFPIFTNGTMIDEGYVALFSKHRNLIPILSIEGSESYTDERRGKGVYRQLFSVMNSLKDHKMLYGTSITLTKENIKEVTEIDYLNQLYEAGSKAVFFIEYVPVTEDTKVLAPQDAERVFLEERLKVLRAHYEDMLFIAFPGDEKRSGGCLAAGRGFFHINAQGGAEPCPFSPYSDTSLKDTSLREAINSPLFRKLRDNHILMEDHSGGCVLFEKQETVQKLIQRL